VRYLQWLGGDDELTVLEFSRSVLATKPALGLKIFTRVPVNEEDDVEVDEDAVGGQGVKAHRELRPLVVLEHLKTCHVNDDVAEANVKR
jgi:hypothetical protein